ncbi:DUF503 domain-containing protein [soil metagenome]|nr:DUF503 domain-containing protein [Trueperaceae bacterium]
MATHVAVMHVELSMPWVGSLKEKRSLVTPLVERVRARFPVSVARVGGLDAHDWERLAIAAVGSDADTLHGIMARVERFLAGGEVRIRRTRLDVEVWDDGDDEPA